MQAYIVILGGEEKMVIVVITRFACECVRLTTMIVKEHLE